MTTLPVVRIKLRASLDEERDLTSIYSWLDRWKPAISSCTRTGGVWDERYEVVVPERALTEIPDGIFYCRLPD